MGTPRVALITGGAGFIGRHVVAALAREADWRLVVVDSLTYAAHPAALRELAEHADLHLETCDVADAASLDGVFARWRPQVVLHLAAETHVDRSLQDAAPFLRTNVLGTHAVVRACVAHRVERLVQVSTDEVYGDREDRAASREGDPVAPTNAYAASKACGDQLVLAAVRAEGLDAVVTRGVNTFGAGQFPEKLLPLAARRWAAGQAMALYGDGEQVRQWVSAEDHAAGILAALHRGERGSICHFAGEGLTNRQVLRRWAEALGRPWDETLLTPVPDRPGHDRRYALDDGATRATLGWAGAARVDFAALAAWTRANPRCWDAGLDRRDVQEYFARQYGQAR